MAALDETFLDDTMIEDLQSVARSVNRPTKYVNNPVVGNSSWTWDRDINFVQPLDRGSGAVDLWYVGYPTTGGARSCYATSADGLSFTRPTVGLVTYSGNTTNNIVLNAADVTGVYFDNALTPKYIGVSSSKEGAANYGVYLVSSSDGTTWTHIKTIYSGAEDGDYREGRTVSRRSDGRWLVYYIYGGIVDRRAIGCYLSDTTDPAGSWRDLGVCIDTSSADRQRYHFHQRPCGDALIGLACRFVRSTEQMDYVELLTSRDGRTWRTLDKQWMSVGASAAWDDEMVIPSLPLIESGNDWRMYYTGFGADHAAALPREARVGIATISKGRIAGIGTNGTVRLRPITTGLSDALTVNCNAAGGSLRVELLDRSGRVLPGYSRDDCTPITADTYGSTVTWGGSGLPASAEVRLVFVLSGATLHRVVIGAA